MLHGDCMICIRGFYMLRNQPRGKFFSNDYEGGSLAVD